MEAQTRVMLLGVVSAAGLLAFAVTWLAIPYLIPYARKWSHMDHPGGRKLHRDATPLVGGMAMAVGMLAGALLCAIAMRAGYGAVPLSADAAFLAAVAGGAIVLFSVGALDDRVGLGPLVKLSAQLVAAAPLIILASAATRPSWISAWLPAAAGLLWLLANANTFNLLDGLDGLMGSVALLCALGFATLAWTAGQWAPLLLSVLLAGALAGFLPWNLPPARTFAGDAGSLLVGYLLAAISLRIMYAAPAAIPALRPSVEIAPLLILAVPLYELCSVIWVRFREGRHLLSGDTSHLAHRLLRRGLSPLQTLGAISACTLLTVVAGVLLTLDVPRVLVPVALLCALATALMVALELRIHAATARP